MTSNSVANACALYRRRLTEQLLTEHLGDRSGAAPPGKTASPATTKQLAAAATSTRHASSISRNEAQASATSGKIAHSLMSTAKPKSRPATTKRRVLTSSPVVSRSRTTRAPSKTKSMQYGSRVKLELTKNETGKEGQPSARERPSRDVHDGERATRGDRRSRPSR